jgi:hypothetical protein
VGRELPIVYKNQEVIYILQCTTFADPEEINSKILKRGGWGTSLIFLHG